MGEEHAAAGHLAARSLSKISRRGVNAGMRGGANGRTRRVGARGGDPTALD